MCVVFLTHLCVFEHKQIKGKINSNVFFAPTHTNKIIVFNYKRWLKLKLGFDGRSIIFLLQLTLWKIEN